MENSSSMPLLPVAIIADDVTGAADTAAKFAGTDRSVAVALSGQAVSGEATSAFAVTTDSRACPPDVARERVLAAARAVVSAGAGLVYKKVDSNLRGNIGAELAALRESRLGPMVLAPAFPARGRTTVCGIALVEGVPVAETEMGRDPEAPVRQSKIVELLAAQQDDLRVRHAHPDHLRDARGSLDRLLAECDVLVFDAETDGDLEVIAAAALNGSPPPVLAGSAGLAGAVAKLLLGPAARPSWSAGRSGPVLAVLASSSERLVRQVAAVRDDATVIALPCAKLTWDDDLVPELNEAIAQAVAELGAGRDAVVYAAGPLPDVPNAVALVVEHLAHLAYVVVRRAGPKGMLVGGGATAQAVLATLDVRAINVDDEPLPGMSAGVAVGGELDGRPVVLKPGAAGGESAVAELVHYLGRRARALEGQA
jgi:uncharacterized protein YgbK (DUF1537 family)